MKNNKVNAAVSPRRFLELITLAAVATVSVTLVSLAMVMSSPATTPERAMKSVVLIDATVERDANPFRFFFGKITRPLDITSWADGDDAPKEIVHYGGTGFMVNGHLVTARHVVVADEGEKVLKITLTTEDGVEARAKVKRSDKASDLAELSTGLDIPSLKLSEKAPKRGQVVTELGNPGLIRFVVSKGTVVGFDREQGYNIAALDTFGGNSGGPVITDSGEVVGVTHTLLSGSRFTGIGTLEALHDFLYLDSIR